MRPCTLLICLLLALTGWNLTIAEANKDGSADLQYSVGNRWSRTATDGLGLGQGDPATITYSFVPDGTFVNGFFSEPPSNSELFALLDGNYASTGEWQDLIHSVFQRWSELTGIQFVHEANDDGADIASASGLLGVRGDIRISAHPIDGTAGTLGYAFFPNDGDIILDSSDTAFFSDSSTNSLRLRNLIAQQVGLAIGIYKACPEDGTKIMEPTLSLDIDGPQHDDILGAQRSYGDRFEANESAAAATDLGSIDESASTTLEDVGLWGGGDIDYYRFTLDGRGEIAVRLQPVGWSYQVGQANPDGSCGSTSLFNSLAQVDLAFDIFDSDGTSLLATRDDGGLGQEEHEPALTIVTAGDYYVRVRAAAEDAAQLYRLDIGFRPATELPQADLVLVIDDGRDLYAPGESVSYNLTLTNNGPEAADGATLSAGLNPLLAGLSWTASYGGGASGPASGVGAPDFSVTTLPVSGTVSLAIQTTLPDPAPALRLRASAQAATPAGMFDPDPANNDALDDDSCILGTGRPQHVEEFLAFRPMSGSPPDDSPNDTGTEFTAGNNSTTAGGFLADTSLAPNGRGLRFQSDEEAFLLTKTSLGGYTQRSHQLAFHFRFSNLDAAANNSMASLMTVLNKGAPNLAYALMVGKDVAGVQGVSLNIPTGGGSGQTLNVALAPDTWHRCVVQYTSASDADPTVLDAGIAVWFNPTSASDAPDLEFLPSDGIMSSEYGDGPLGQYALGNLVYSSTGAAFTILADSIGSWDGFGTAGENSLTEALRFLDTQPVALNHAPVLEVASSAQVVEGQALSLAFTVTDPDLLPDPLNLALDARAPDHMLINTISDVLYWVPGEAEGPGEYVFSFSVEDSGIIPLSDSAEITVSVLEDYQAPVLEPVAPVSIEEGSALSFTAIASDDDLPGQALTFSLIDGPPAGASIDAVSGLFEWTPTAAGSYEFGIRVTDDGDPARSAEQPVTIEVTPVTGPPARVCGPGWLLYE